MKLKIWRIFDKNWDYGEDLKIFELNIAMLYIRIRVRSPHSRNKIAGDILLANVYNLPLFISSTNYRSAEVNFCSYL